MRSPVWKNKDIDIDVLIIFSENSRYNTPPKGIVHSNDNKKIPYKRNVIRNMDIESTVLTSNFKKIKGALAVLCSYMTETSRVRRGVGFISAHLSARSDLDQNPDPSRQTHFLRRIDDMYDVLHECDRWHKLIHGLVETGFLPFNIILEVDLNFRMIKKGQDHHFDEGEIVLRNFGFDKSHKNCTQTYRFKKQEINQWKIWMIHIRDRWLHMIINKALAGQIAPVFIIPAHHRQPSSRWRNAHWTNVRGLKITCLSILCLTLRHCWWVREAIFMTRHAEHLKSRLEAYKHANWSCQQDVHRDNWNDMLPW